MDDEERLLEEMLELEQKDQLATIWIEELVNEYGHPHGNTRSLVYAMWSISLQRLLDRNVSFRGIIFMRILEPDQMENMHCFQCDQNFGTNSPDNLFQYCYKCQSLGKVWR